MVDRDGLPPSFDEWLVEACHIEAIVGSRFDTRRIVLDAGKFIEWCRGLNRAPDAISRDQYLNEVAGGLERLESTISIRSGLPPCGPADELGISGAASESNPPPLKERNARPMSTQPV